MILWLLLVGHALTDFPLQGDFLAKGKNHRAPLPGVPWFPCLLAHAVISGGAVTVVTGSLGLGIAEAVVHAVVDFLKCDGRIDFNSDQVIHVFCKVLWAMLLPYLAP